MLKKTRRLNKLWKLWVLLIIKESYLFLKNLFGLKSHPFKTLKVMSYQKDRSQQVLIFGLPVYGLGVGVGLVWLGRRWLATTVEWGMAAKATSLLVLVVVGGVGGYLGYWWLKIVRNKYE